MVKGHLIRGVLRWLKSNGGGTIADTVSKLPPRVAGSFDRPIVPSSWYPYSAWTQLLRVVDREYGRGDLSLLPTLGHDALDADLKGFLKLLTVFVSPDSMVDRGFNSWGQVYWNRLFDHGKISIASRADEHAAMRLIDFEQVDRAHCLFMCGYFKRGFEAVGATDMVVTHNHCIAKGHTDCIYSGYWGEEGRAREEAEAE